MEQQYGLSPRGGKPTSRGKGNVFQSASLGKNAKYLSASHEDLTRLDRHQPIIIQNFELLSPNQLKFRRPSLSTANLYLSHASLSRSGGVNAVERPATTTAGGNRHPGIPIWSENRGNEMSGNDKLQTMKEGVQASSSSSSCSSSSKQRSPDKQKRVTFSSKNTLYPYEPDQTPRSNSKFRKTDFIYPSKNEAFYQFQPFHYPAFDGKENSSVYNDLHKGKNGTVVNDLKAYNEHWIPRESLSSPKPNAHSTKPRLPQRSSLKQTSAANSERVKQVHSNLDDHWSSGQVNGFSGQYDMHFSGDPTPETEANDGRQNTDTNMREGNLNVKCVHNTPFFNLDTGGDGVSTKPNLLQRSKTDEDVEVEVNDTNSNLAAMKSRDLNNGVEDLTSISTSTNDNESKCEDQDSNLALPDLESNHIGDILKTNAGDTLKGIPSAVASSADDTNLDTFDDKNDDEDREFATSFIDVFSSYNIPDNEYNASQNGDKRQQREDVINNISREIQSSNSPEAYDDNKFVQPMTNSTSNGKINDSDSNVASSSSSNPKVIRLKFLADSGTQKDSKLNNHGASQEVRRETDVHGNGQTLYMDNNGSAFSSNPRHSVTSRQQPKSASLSRQLKTKSTIEAIDLSTLGHSPNERPRSQGDINAQFLMNMYSASGDRKTSEELEKQEQEEQEQHLSRPPSRKPTDKRVTYSAEEDSNHITYRDPLTSSSRGRQKERQFLTSSKGRFKAHAPLSARPLLRNRASSAHAMMVTGNRMLGTERVIAAEKFLIKTGNPTSSDRTALNRQLEQLIVSRSVSSRVKQTMERSRSNLM